MSYKDQVYLDKLKVMESLSEYASPKSKLTSLVQSEDLVRIRRGLYLPGGVSYSLKTLANIIYGPSYISFEYALSYYRLIPERAVNITSASFSKNKHKQYNTPVGSFVYRPIPPDAYSFEYRRFEENGHPFLIATVEKALCDTLYQHRHVQSYKRLEELLFGGLRL